MKLFRYSLGVALGSLIAVGSAATGAAKPAPARQTAAAKPVAGLRVVVVAGEDAVNIIQQRTAVAPIAEVRDRNDQPVSGALVTFAVRGGGRVATFGGRESVTTTTDAAGRAAATQHRTRT